jgi:hypothetical protein
VSEEKPRVDLNLVQVVASALAAVSSAVLLSTVGVAGTLIGAAVGSVIATVGSAVYSYSLRASRERVAAAAQLAAAARVRRVGHEHDQRTQQLTVEEEAEDAGRPAWREALDKMPWKRVALVAAAVFVVAMIVIVSFELVAGKPVSEITGGTKDGTERTSVPGLGGTASTPSKSPTATPSGSGTASGSASPSIQPSASTSPTAGSSQRSAAPSASPSASPTGAPSVTPSPSPPVSASPSSVPSAPVGSPPPSGG